MFLSCQDDKDLVHEFVVAEGLTCLIKVGAEADQNYQNYILRGKSPLGMQGQPPLHGGQGSSPGTYILRAFEKTWTQERGGKYSLWQKMTSSLAFSSS